MCAQILELPDIPPREQSTSKDPVEQTIPGTVSAGYCAAEAGHRLVRIHAPRTDPLVSQAFSVLAPI